MGDISVKNRDWSGAEELKALSEGTRKVSKKKVIPELKAALQCFKKKYQL